MENQEKTPDEIVTIDGKKYKKIHTGYTERQYFSHNTPEKGPGPGWDRRLRYFEEKGLDHDEFDKLSDEPYYRLESSEE